MAVRWDAVVERGRFWSEPARPAVSALTDPNSQTSVQVFLFGSLADAVPERPLTLQLCNPFSIGDVFAELRRRCGSDFLSRITAGDGTLLRHCRIYANGEEVEDARMPIHADDNVSQIEIIVLTAAEGG
jgi:hypothetical protein